MESPDLLSGITRSSGCCDTLQEGSHGLKRISPLSSDCLKKKKETSLLFTFQQFRLILNFSISIHCWISQLVLVLVWLARCVGG